MPVWIFDQIQNAREELAARLRAADVNDDGILEFLLEEFHSKFTRLFLQCIEGFVGDQKARFTDAVGAGDEDALALCDLNAPRYPQHRPADDSSNKLTSLSAVTILSFGESPKP